MERNKCENPNMMYVPADLLEDQYIQASFARTHGKFPILTYYSSNKKAAIWRSSELLPQTNSNRNSDDEFFLKSIGKSVNGKNELIIMSARSLAEKDQVELGFE